MRKLILSIMIASLAGCSMGHRDPTEIKHALNEAVNENNSSSVDDLPDSVQADLMPDVDGSRNSANSSVKRFRVQAQNVNAKTFFASLVQGTDYSVVVHPDVAGQVTLNLSDVTLDEVLNSVRDIYGYDVIKTGKVIQVYPAGLRTETIPVDYLQFKRRGMSLTTITTGSVTSEYDDDDNDSDSSSSNSTSSSNNSDSDDYDSGDGMSTETNATGGTRIESTTQSDFWPQLQKALKTMVGNGSGRSVIVSPQAGVVTIRAYPNELREVKAFLGASEKRLHRQVVLEAKIMEVTLSDGYQQGINWSNLSGSIGGTTITGGTSGSGIVPGLNTIGDLLGGGTNMVISDGNFSAVMNFMATQGDLNVLSSPRVTASNNQKAVIKVGEDKYYVTDVDGEVGSGDNANVSQDVDLTPFFSGISLDVTPQIDDKGNVMMHVHPAVIDVTTENTLIDLGSNGGILELPLAKSSIRESDTVVRAKDGDVIVIGGLMSTATVEQTTKVPFLGDVPGLGHLFRNTNQLTKKTELVILLKPTVVGVNTWSQEVEKSRDLLQEWFPDSE
ncbi:pilus (MSHA type) biogenesis protein MshL [Vibrio sp. CK2-1]|uniref:pilus (MSHA type) biogenesis protein MshL n=1 Tax=Vibrio sp. CK2-1 TaxID=2912249 RepID=UPI001F01B7DA|nr:pilus (MSHA type) biogenesis protein MshL [Vibrio sp. CK2-1]MCF7353821.1 pilus (MSHA type) biogenesis protein MshL [Vibrio sp. CK2-1]